MSPTDFFSRISVSEEYQSFRGSIPLKKITVEEDKTWQVFDTGPKSQAGLPTLHMYYSLLQTINMICNCTQSNACKSECRAVVPWSASLPSLALPTSSSDRASASQCEATE